MRCTELQWNRQYLIIIRPFRNRRIGLNRTCVGSDDTVIDGTLEAGNKTKFIIEKISQSYVIQRADQTAFDLQFYIYVDNEIRKLPSDSLKKVYKWNHHGECFLSVSDLAEIYKEYGLKETDNNIGKFFPYTVRGGEDVSTCGMEDL